MTNRKLEVLARQIEDEIQRNHRRRRKNRRLASLIRLSILVATAAIPVVLGFKAPETSAALRTNVAVVLGGLATALNAWETFYGHRNLWAANTAAWAQLVALKAEFLYITSNEEAVTEELLDQVQKQFQRILTEANSAWVGVRQSGTSLPAPVALN